MLLSEGAGEICEEGKEQSCVFPRIAETDTSLLARDSGQEAKPVIALQDKFEIVVSLRCNSQIKGLKNHSVTWVSRAKPNIS